MKTEILSKETVIYGKEFHEDLASLEKVNPDAVSEIGKWLDGLEKFDSALDPVELIAVSRKTKLSIEDIQTLLKPIVLMALTCAEHRATIDDLVADLVEAGVLQGSLVSSEFLFKIKKMGQPLTKLALEEEKKTAPQLPLKYIRRIVTRSVIVSEFERNFNVEEDDPSTYKPRLRYFYPAITLRLKFKGEKEEEIGILLSPEDLKRLKKWLELAEVELSVVAKSIPQNYLAYEQRVK